MAARQPHTHCAPIGILLLLIGVTITHLPQVNARPTDFWCNYNARKNIMKRVELLLQQKRAEVLEAFQVFQEGVHLVGNQTSSECWTSLGDLEHSITQYVAVVRRVHIQSENSTSFQTVRQICGFKTSLSEVLTSYMNLIKGKLNLLALDLSHTLCHQ